MCPSGSANCCRHARNEGGPFGAAHERKHLNYEPETVAEGLATLDRIGSEWAFNHYRTGRAQVSNTPLKWYKKDTHGGGIRAPLIVSWPGRLRGRRPSPLGAQVPGVL